MALFSTILLSNIDSSLLFSYRFPTMGITQQYLGILNTDFQWRFHNSFKKNFSSNKYAQSFGFRQRL